MLVEKNKIFNLTAHKTLERSWEFNILDSLLFNDEIAKFFKQNARVIDLGSGSGSPAIPIKLSFPQIDLIMIDSTRKKVDFLTEVIADLGLKNARAIHARIEEFAKEKDSDGISKNKSVFDVVTARAVAPLDTLLKLGFPLLKKGGALLAFKGKNYADEIEVAKHTLARLGGKVLEIHEKQLGEQARSMLVIRR